MNVRRYESHDAPRIARLNDRLTAGGAHWPVYPEGPHDNPPGCPVTSRLFVAEDGDEIRGAVWLREHDFQVAGQTVRAGWAKYPVAESLVNPAYSGVPGALLIRLLREQPRLMALGLGGHQGPFARLLAGLRWSGESVPFYLMPVRPSRVLRHLPHLRHTAARRVALNALAWSGLGWLGWKVVELARRAAAGAPARNVSAEVVDRFDSWADDIWNRCHAAYAFVARRDAAMLETVFPRDMPVVRLRVRRDGADIGWAVVVLREPAGVVAARFGPLTIGLVADGLALPADARAVVSVAAAYLREHGADLLVSNQAHPAWCEALSAAGFVEGPSQFAFYRAAKVAALFGGGVPPVFHVNRGDCDGPLFL